MQFNSRDPDGEIFLDAYKQFFGYSLTFFFLILETSMLNLTYRLYGKRK